MKTLKRTWADISLDNLEYNYRSIRSRLPYGCRFLGVMKADAYGHGAVPVSRALADLGAEYLAVSNLEEAVQIRRGEVRLPILILGYTFPYSYEDMIREEIRPAVFREDQAKAFSEAAVRLGKTARIHIKVDTAMSRIGIKPDADGLAFIEHVMELPGIEVEGIFTHFAKADEKDKTAVLKQLSIYQAFLKKVEETCTKEIPLKHCSNSAGILELPQANMNLVRAGITLYGLWPSNEVKKEMPLKPVMSLKSHVVYVKTIEKGTQVSYGGTYEAPEKRVIATIPVGYGDGYPRLLSGKGYVLIHGKRAPITGRVCMDQFMVDVTDIMPVAMGDEVTLIGTDGAEKITMEQLGDLSGRFNYELACDISKRVPRAFVKNGEIVATKDYFTDYE